MLHRHILGHDVRLAPGTFWAPLNKVCAAARTICKVSVNMLPLFECAEKSGEATTATTLGIMQEEVENRTINIVIAGILYAASSNMSAGVIVKLTSAIQETAPSL